MRWLIDEMFPVQVAEHLEEVGHGARAAVAELRGLTDEQLFDVATVEERVLVTENVADFVALLQQRIAATRQLTPVVFVSKADPPADPGAFASTLAGRLEDWAQLHPDPAPTAYWL